MKKKDYKVQIHEYFEKLRSNIIVESRGQIFRLEMLERMEREAIEENSQDSLKDVKDYVRSIKKKTYKFPLAGKKITILPSGKIKTEVLP